MLLRILDCYKNRDGEYEKEKEENRKLHTHTLMSYSLFITVFHTSLAFFGTHRMKEEKYSAFMKENFLFTHQKEEEEEDEEKRER